MCQLLMGESGLRRFPNASQRRSRDQRAIRFASCYCRRLLEVPRVSPKNIKPMSDKPADNSVMFAKCQTCGRIEIILLSRWDQLFWNPELRLLGTKNLFLFLSRDILPLNNRGPWWKWPGTDPGGGQAFLEGNTELPACGREAGPNLL